MWSSQFIFAGLCVGARSAATPIGVVALVWFVGTAVYNHVMWQRIMKANPFDKALVGEHAELYGALNIFVLGSLDLMTIFPWTAC